MSSEWPRVELSSCATFQEGYVNPSQKKPEYFGDEIKWLRAVDLNDGYVFETSRKLSKVGFESAGKSAMLFEPGTLAISKSGTIGRIGILKDWVCGNRAVINIKVKEDLCNNRFIFYILLSSRHEIESLAVGSVQKNLYTSSLGKLKFNLPPRHIQDQIAEIVGGLDDKIELNRRTNQTLEQIAQTLFKSWFVDFDPVRAKVAVREHFEQRAAGHGEPVPAPAALEEAQKTAAAATIAGLTFDPTDIDGTRTLLEEKLAGMDSEQRSQLLDTAGLFPEEFIETPNEKYPKGWSWGALSSICELNARSWTKKNAPERLSYVDLANTKNGSINSIENYDWDDAPSRARRILRPGDTIVGTVRPGNRSYARIGRYSSGLTGSTGFAVLTPINVSWTEFLYIAATNDEAIDRLAHLADGGAYPAVRPGVVVEAEMAIPCQSLIEEFSSRVQPMFEMVDTNIQSSQTLTELRDALLPKLLSGEIQLNPEPIAEAS